VRFYLEQLNVLIIYPVCLIYTLCTVQISYSIGTLNVNNFVPVNIVETEYNGEEIKLQAFLTSASHRLSDRFAAFPL